MNKSRNILKEEGVSIQFLDFLTDPIIKIDNKFHLVYVNPSFCSFIGYKESELLEKPFLDFIRKEERLKFRLKLSSQIEPLKEFTIEINLLHNLEYSLSCGLLIQPIENNKTFSFLIKVSFNSANRFPKKLYENLIAIFPLPIALINDNYNFENCNQILNSLLNYKKEELLGRDPLDLGLFNLNSKEKVINSLKNLLNGKKAKPISIQIKPNKKEPIWVEMESSIICLDNKLYIQSVFTDINEKIKAKGQIEELTKFKKQLLSRTSHELKTPLISIKGFSNLLLELYSNRFSKNIISIIQEIKNGSEKLENTIDMILKTTFYDSKKTKFKPQKEDLAFLIRFTLKELRGVYTSRDIKVNLNIHEKMETHFEKEQIYEAFSNLFINAVKYSPPNTEVEIRSEIRDNSYIISIKDQGIGLTKQEVSKIFKPFGKIERYGNGWDLEVGGSGLGLYIAKKIIKLHKGKIWVESEGRERGSIFYFSLPVIQ
ncbi:MAG: Signal transduction histidine kinase [Promethearchaeota archaeon]|nr:MAG: Signal transduction histidine kinase [Candidatus Lokiarchaeota archaeon]